VPAAVAVAAVAVLGSFLLGARGWPLLSGLALVGLLLGGSLRWALQRRRTRAVTAASRIRAKLKVIRGGKAYDLEKDDSTDSQRYLM